MEITETRRSQLKKWFTERTIPPKEKSYLSQLMTGTASFGERAARRLEKDYGMSPRYLDGAEEIDLALARGDHLELVQVKPYAKAEEMDLMWISPQDRELLTLFHGTDDDGRKTILRAAKAVPRVVKPVAVGNKQQ